MTTIDKTEVMSRFKRSKASYDEHATVQKMIVDRIMLMLKKHLNYHPTTILEIGCGTGLLTRRIVDTFGAKSLFINDIVTDFCYDALKGFSIPKEHLLPGDIEELSLSQQFDLIVSASTFQWLNDPEAVFEKLANSLKRDGLLVFSTFGKYNLREIRQTTGGGLLYRTQEDIMEMLKPRFGVEHIREEFKLIEFPDPLAILQHLKKTGVNVSGDKSIWTKGRVSRFIEDYNERFALDGKVTLTYHPLYLICRKK